MVRIQEQNTWDKKEITIDQQGFDYAITLGEKEVSVANFSAFGTRHFDVKVKTNVDFAVEVPTSAESWLKYDSYKVELDRGIRPREVTVRFNWSINSQPNERIADVVFKPKREVELARQDNLLVTQGAAEPIEENTRSGDYAKTADLLRPGHADYTAYAKYHGFQDARGGGHFSGRITAALVAGGAIVLGALNRAGIDITTHIARCAGISDTPFALDDAAALAAQVSVLESRDEGFALLDASVEEPMKTAIRAAGSEGDSVGGILETAILGLPAGVGEPYFDSVESLISHMAFSVPAVKGIEFGTGFGFADLKGSEANDAFRMKGDSVVTATNHNAGINGGITNGMPVVFRTAVKPTPSIYKEQETVDYIAKQDAPLSIQGRHDPCIVPRAAIVQTCAAALAVGDLMTARYGTAWMERPTSYRREGL